MKYPYNNDTCFRIDVIDLVVDENFQDNNFVNTLEGCLSQSMDAKCDNEKIHESVMQLKANPPFSQPYIFKYETLDRQLKSRSKPSIEESPILEFKPLPSHLKYAFLEK